MKCPFCNASDTKVIDSRPADDNSSIKAEKTVRAVRPPVHHIRKAGDHASYDHKKG